jgi:hypothetical protein
MPAEMQSNLSLLHLSYSLKLKKHMHHACATRALYQDLIQRYHTELGVLNAHVAKLTQNIEEMEITVSLVFNFACIFLVICGTAEFCETVCARGRGGYSLVMLVWYVMNSISVRGPV